MATAESSFNQEEKRIILNTASAAIDHGLKTKQPLIVNLSDYNGSLQAERASFVTIQLNNSLRGCIGSLQAHRPLLEDIAYNAYAAAFNDPRFSPLSKAEYDNIELHVSVLSIPEPLNFSSEADLLQQIRSGIDGLILSAEGHCGTFLPSVWEQLPEKTLFWQHLKNKAGLPQNYWSDRIRVERYTAEMIK